LSHLNEAAAEMLAICSDQDLADGYFKIVDCAELSVNEFNLNLPRYIRTYPIEQPIDLVGALASMKSARERTVATLERINYALDQIGAKE
jgi:hypothetical protein